MDKETSATAIVRMIPGAITFPLLMIAFHGCWFDGCQGALDAQSKAVHSALIAGGWIADKD